jgi:hypothetical protein
MRQGKGEIIDHGIGGLSGVCRRGIAAHG